MPARRLPASRLRGFGTTIFTEMTRLAQQHGAVNLAQGFPDFPGPAFVKDAAVRAIAADANQYARMQGAPELTWAIARDVHARTGIAYDAATEVLVTCGATEALHAALLALTEPGDEVVMLEPFYDSYRACCAMAGAVPRCVTLHAPAFRWREDELRAAFGPRTRLLLLNTPHNPTGRVLSRAELELLAQLCVEHDVLCVTDEVYGRLVFEGEHVSIATLPGMLDRTLVIDSMGKTFSLTGWKVGWATGPADVVGALATAHQFITFSIATPFQHALAAALEQAGPRGYHDAFLRAYRERRDYLCDVLTACGLEVLRPEGTYFVMADIRPLGWDDDVAFCRHLVEEVGVAAIPPTAFYEHRDAGRFLVRFAFCKSMDTLHQAAGRLRSRLRRRV